MRYFARRIALVVITAVASLMVVAALTTPPQAIRLVLTLPVVFALSGAASLWASYPRLELGSAERFTASIGLSLAITVVCWVLVGSTPLGITRISVGVALGGLTVAAALIALARTFARERPDHRTSPDPIHWPGQ
jgi:uncharacterized membrane protein